jgi:hypothetical protein
MPFRCKQAFPREEKCLNLLRSVLQSFTLAPVDALFLFAVLEIEPEVLCMLGRH